MCPFPQEAEPPPQCFPCSMTFTSISPSVFPGWLFSQDVNRLFIKRNQEGCICESGVKLLDQIGLVDTGSQQNSIIIFAVGHARTFSTTVFVLEGARWLVPFPTHLITECSFMVLLQDGFLGQRQQDPALTGQWKPWSPTAPRMGWGDIQGLRLSLVMASSLPSSSLQRWPAWQWDIKVKGSLTLRWLGPCSEGSLSCRGGHFPSSCALSFLPGVLGVQALLPMPPVVRRRLPPPRFNADHYREAG